jgi:hypothetical protein
MGFVELGEMILHSPTSTPLTYRSQDFPLWENLGMSELEEEIHILNGFKRMLNRKIRDELRGESSNLDSLTAFVELRLQLSDKVEHLNRELGKKTMFQNKKG